MTQSQGQAEWHSPGRTSSTCRQAWASRSDHIFKGYKNIRSAPDSLSEQKYFPGNKSSLLQRPVDPLHHGQSHTEHDYKNCCIG
jgi:hypothetical protein